MTNPAEIQIQLPPLPLPAVQLILNGLATPQWLAVNNLIQTIGAATDKQVLAHEAAAKQAAETPPPAGPDNGGGSPPGTKKK